MFRGARVLTWSCKALSLRKPHLAPFSKHSGAGWQRVREEKKSQETHGSKAVAASLPAETLSCSIQPSSFSLTCNNQQASFQNLGPDALRPSCHHTPQVSASAKAKQVFNSQKWAVVKELGHNLKAQSLCSVRPWDVCQPLPSFQRKPHCSPLQGSSHRRFSSLTHQPWISHHSLCRPQPPSVYSHQARAVHQAAPHVADTWTDCLSTQNENRCRQSLVANLKHYEVDKGRRGASPSPSQGKSQAKWASILVSLCCVGGEPAFLFTLRSSTLKGRHKGDVSFAGGKSDPSDRDVVATALREAREELGVDVATERVWGILNPLRDRSGMMVAPVLANLGPLEELSFKPNPGEVEEIFTLSLSHLCNPQNCGYTHFRTGNKYGYTLPVFRNGKHRVWGLTAIALTHALNLIVPS